MSIQPIGVTPTRIFDYLALAKVRGQQTLLARNPNHNAFSQRAARYARKKAAAVKPLVAVAVKIPE